MSNVKFPADMVEKSSYNGNDYALISDEQDSSKTKKIKISFFRDTNNKGWYADITALQTAYPTATNGSWAILGSTDTVWVWDSGTSAWVNTDTKGQVASVNGKSGVVVLDKTDIGLANVDNTSDVNKPVSTAQASAIALKADQATTYTKTETDAVATQKALGYAIIF